MMSNYQDKANKKQETNDKDLSLSQCLSLQQLETVTAAGGAGGYTMGFILVKQSGV